MNDQVKAVVIGACIAILGALAVYIPTSFIENKEFLAQFGPYGPFAAALAAIGVNVIRKVIEYLTARKKELEK